MTTTETTHAAKIERILTKEWDKSDADRGSLRTAFENNALHTEDRPVLVRTLTENAIDDIFDVLVNHELGEGIEATEGRVLAHGKSWVLFANTEEVEEVLGQVADIEETRLGYIDFPNFDPSDAQMAFVEKAVTRGIRVMETKLRAAIA